MNNPTISLIRSRRITRFFSQKPVPRESLEIVIEVGRWAPSSGNRRLQKFVVLENPTTIRHIRLMSPGLDGIPQAVIVICTDWQKAGSMGITAEHPDVKFDVGMAAENMLLAAHALAIGAGPVTSFSKSALQVFLNLPSFLSPDILITLGYPAEQVFGGKVHPPKTFTWRNLTYWEKYDPDRDDKF